MRDVVILYSMIILLGECSNENRVVLGADEGHSVQHLPTHCCCRGGGDLTYHLTATNKQTLSAALGNSLDSHKPRTEHTMVVIGDR
jgi:hypothetical protein